jgi:chorismate mutase
MMLIETFRAEIARVDGNLAKLRARRLRIVGFCFRRHNRATFKAINAEIRMWKRYRQTLF